MKTFFKIGFAVIVLVLGLASCKNNKEEKEPLQQAELSENYFTPSEVKYTLDSPDYLFDKFFPIGWSKDGKFAYITEPADEAAGLYFFEIAIMDMTTNQIVWEWKPENDDLEESGSVPQMWEQHKELFTQKLKEYGIEQQKSFKIIPSEFTFKGNDYLIEETVVENDPESDNYYIGAINNVSYALKSPKGEKVIFRNVYEEYSGVLNETLCGVIMSPFEDRAAAVTSKMMRGYEGPPHVITFMLFNIEL